jgi:hypothetical protein
MDEFTNFDFQGLVKADRMHGRFKIKSKPDPKESMLLTSATFLIEKRS